VCHTSHSHAGITVYGSLRQYNGSSHEHTRVGSTHFIEDLSVGRHREMCTGRRKTQTFGNEGLRNDSSVFGEVGVY